MTLVATVTEGGEVVTQEEVTFLVSPSDEPGPQPQVEIVRPADGSRFDASDDNDPGSPGFQTVVRATTLEVSDGTEFTLALNDSAAGTATVVDGVLVFTDVTLTEGSTTIEVSSQISETLTVSDSVSVTVETGSCEVALQPAPTDTCAFNAASTDEDVDAAGFQTTLTVSTDCAEVELLVGGVSFATANAASGVATFTGVTLNEGETEIQAVARSGEQEGASPVLTYVSDFTIPVIAVDASVASGTITRLDDLDATAEGIQWSAFGPVSEESSVTVSIGDTAGIAAAIADGIWTAEPFTFLTDGSFDVVATAVDACGNTGVSETLTVSVVAQADDISVVTPVTGAVFGIADDGAVDSPGLQSSFTVNSTLAEGASVRVDCSLDGGLPVTVGTGTTDAAGSATINVTLAEGVLSCVAVSESDASVTSQAVALTVDLTAPTVSIVAPVDGAVVTSLTTELSVLVGNITTDDEVTVAWTLDGGTPVNVSLIDRGFVDTVTFPAAGDYLIGVAAQDGAGNEGAAVVSVSVVIDDVAPVLTAVAPLEGAILDETSVRLVGGALFTDATVAIDSCDGVAEVCAAANALAPVCQPCAPELTFTNLSITPGLNTVTYSATDAFANTGTLDVSFTVNVDLPFLVITDPLDGDVLNTALINVVAQTDLAEGTPVELLINESVSRTESVLVDGSITFAGVTLDPGVNALQVRGSDARGLGSSPTVRVTLDEEPPALVFVSPTDGTVFSGSSADASGAPGFQVNVDVAWTDNNTVVSGTLTVACGTTTFDVTGTVAAGTLSFSGVTLPAEDVCTLTAAATDAAGNTGNASVTITVDRVAPVIDSLVITSDANNDGFLNIGEAGAGAGARAATVAVALTGIEDGQVVEVRSTNPVAGTVVGSSPVAGGVATVNVSLSQGAHTLSAAAVDASGNATTGSPSDSVVVDTIAPSLSFTDPLNGIELSNPNDTDSVAPGIQYAVQLATDLPDGSSVSLTANPDGAGTTSLGSLPVAGGVATSTVTLPTGNAVALTISAQDAAGNVSSQTISVGVFDVPVCDIAFADVTGNQVFNASDDESAVTAGVQVTFDLVSTNPRCDGLTTTVFVDGTPFTATLTGGLASVVATFPTNGSGTFFGQLAAPARGTATDTPAFGYLSDDVPPVIVSLGGVSAGSASTIALTLANRVGATWPLVAVVTGGNGGTASTTLAATPYSATISAGSASFAGVTAADGTYTVTLVATDSVGNTDTESFTVLVDGNAPDLSAATFTLNRRSGAADFSVPTVSDGVRYELFIGTSATVDWVTAATDPDYYTVFNAPGLPAVLDLSVPEAPLYDGDNFGAIRATDVNGNVSERVFPAAFFGFLTRDFIVPITDIRRAAALGDINSDGFEDFAVGGYIGTASPTSSTCVILYGAATVAEATTQQLPTPTGAQNFGVFPNRVGDVNGDGVNDLLVSATMNLSTETLNEVFLYLGSTTAGAPISTTPTTRISLTATAFTGGLTSFGGYTMSSSGNVWQLTADPASGIEDIVIGAGGVDMPINAAVESDGILFVIAGRTSWPATINLTTNPTNNTPFLVQTLVPSIRQQRLGRQTGIVNDSNGDGLDEIISFSGAGGTGGFAVVGRILVWRGVTQPTTLAAPDRIYSASNTASTGNALSLNGTSTAGDINGDGFTDAVGLDFGSTTQANRLDLVLNSATLPASGTVPLTATVSPDTTLRAGTVLSAIGDSRRDGDSPLAGPDFSDMLLRVRLRADANAPQEVLLLRNTGVSPFFANDGHAVLFAEAGFSAGPVSSAALFNDDGFGDFLITAATVPAASSLVRLYF
ncbi:MAG: VCBS repeat-containing protein [Myxococcales bacterium]|nr:VCBS repeat-containing protein [Myxococcales bacterium]